MISILFTRDIPDWRMSLKIQIEARCENLEVKEENLGNKCYLKPTTIATMNLTRNPESNPLTHTHNIQILVADFGYYSGLLELGQNIS